MPLPLGHTAIGLATHDLSCKGNSTTNPWKTFLLVLFLANLPDIDILIGLVIHSNGNVFHRGPTHSLLFALAMSLLASSAWKIWPRIPRVSLLVSFLLILSHVLADAILTTAPVSFFWPLEVNWQVGLCGWKDVIDSIFLRAFQDVGIIFGSGMIIVLNRLLRNRVVPFVVARPAKVMISSMLKGR